MASINKVILVGNLGADPELRYTAAGQPVCDLRLATSRRYKGRDGTAQEDTEWHRVVVWGKLAETCKQYLAKGRAAYIEGRLQTSSWEDRDGKKRWSTEIVAQTVQFLGGRKSGSAHQPLDEDDSSSVPPPQNGESLDRDADELPF